MPSGARARTSQAPVSGNESWGLRNPSPDQLLPVMRAAHALLAAGDTDAARELLEAFSVDPAQAGPALSHPSATGSGENGGEDGGTGPGRPETDALGPGQRPVKPRPDPGHTSGRGA